MSKIRVNELLPGDVLAIWAPTQTAGCCITVTDHPIYNGFSLVVWRLSDGGMSFDALLPEQVLLGHRISATVEERRERWAAATRGQETWLPRVGVDSASGGPA